MKNLIFWVKKKKQAFIYAIFLFFAFEMMVKVYQEFAPGQMSRFYFTAILFGLILLGLLFYGLLFIRKRYTDSEVRQIILPLIRIHVLHQIILPVLLYIGMVGFIFFYPYDVITHVMIFVISGVYWLLFVNIQAIFNRDFALENFTQGIYNLVKVFVFFLIITVNLELFHYFGSSSFIIGVVTIFVSMLLLVLTLMSYLQTSRTAIIIAGFFSFIIGVFAWFIGSLFFASYFHIGLYLTILYYLLSSLLQHKAEGTLNLSVFIEYFAIALLSMMILSSKF